MIMIFKVSDKIKPIKKLPKKYRLYIDVYVDFFKNNKEKLYTSDELCDMWLVSNTSIIRQIINYMRIELYIPIVSTSKGYKYTMNKKELKIYKKKLLYRALTIVSAAKSIKTI